MCCTMYLLPPLLISFIFKVIKVRRSESHHITYPYNYMELQCINSRFFPYFLHTLIQWIYFFHATFVVAFRNYVSPPYETYITPLEQYEKIHGLSGSIKFRVVRVTQSKVGQFIAIYSKCLRTVSP